MKCMKLKTIREEEEVPFTLNGFSEWEFTTGVTTGDDFQQFAKLFKRFVRNNIPSGAIITNWSVGHYILSGFIQYNGIYVYISISDVRHFKNGWADEILIRLVAHNGDYTGGANHFTSLNRFKADVESLFRGGENK